MEANINLLKIMFLTLPVSEKKWYLLPLMVGMLGTLAWWFSVNFSADDSQKYQELRQKLCDSGKLNLEEILLLSKLLEKSEGLQITDLEFLKELFCAGKDYIFPDKKRFAKIFGKINFHRNIKQEILKDAKKFIRKVGTKNPDIGYTKLGRIVLKHPKTNRVVETDLLFKWYK